MQHMTDNNKTRNMNFYEPILHDKKHGEILGIPGVRVSFDSSRTLLEVYLISIFVIIV